MLDAVFFSATACCSLRCDKFTLSCEISLDADAISPTVVDKSFCMPESA